MTFLYYLLIIWHIDVDSMGFVSWEPTNIPVSAEIGHNCIAAKYKGNVYGRQQMQEAVRRIIAQGVKKLLLQQMKFLFLHNALMRINYEIIIK